MGSTLTTTLLFISILALELVHSLKRNNGPAVSKFTNLQCETFDPSFVVFSQCRLRVVRRDEISANIHVKLLQLPVTDIVLNGGLYKKANGYKRFLYNFTEDICQFLRSASTNILLRLAIGFFKDFSNLNHSCPYNNDIIIKNFIVSEDKFRLLPLPSGEYMINALASSYNERRLSVKIFWSRAE